MMSDEMMAAFFDDERGLAELGRLYNCSIGDDSRQFTRWQMIVAMNHGVRLAIEATTVKGDGLVERLLNDEVKQGPEADPLCQEAADTITTLKGEIERLDRALDDAVATIAAVRATTTVPEEWAASAKHFHDVCGDTLVRIRQALGSTDNVG